VVLPTDGVFPNQIHPARFARVTATRQCAAVLGKGPLVGIDAMHMLLCRVRVLHVRWRRSSRGAAYRIVTGILQQRGVSEVVVAVAVAARIRSAWRLRRRWAPAAAH
jgi:hypothetical protein